MISSRTLRQDAYQAADRDITALMRLIVTFVTGILVSYGTQEGYGRPDGPVPARYASQVRHEVRRTVEPLFVQRAATAEGDREHLDDLIARAREALDGASGAEQRRILARLRMLTDRYELLAAGTALVALRGEYLVTPFARIILEQTDFVTRGVVESHASAIARLLQDAPDVKAWLEQHGMFSGLPRMLGTYQPTRTWIDLRGYTLSDRIWNVSESTLARIDAVLDDGILRGRAAVDIADDVQQFLLPSRQGVLTKRPYGTTGSFDARRLARTEITRAHALTDHMAALDNPFVQRGTFNLSRYHASDPGDICEALARESEDKGGYPVEELPLPVVNTHPQCLCYNTFSTGESEAVIADLRNDMRAGAAPPLTPLAAGAFITALAATVTYADARRQQAA